MIKQRDARIITLEQDYAPRGKVIGAEHGMPFVKGSRHAIHAKTAENLRKNGVKMRVEKVDFDALNAKIKQQRAKATA